MKMFLVGFVSCLLWMPVAASAAGGYDGLIPSAQPGPGAPPAPSASEEQARKSFELMKKSLDDAEKKKKAAQGDAPDKAKDAADEHLSLAEQKEYKKSRMSTSQKKKMLENKALHEMEEAAR